MGDKHDSYVTTWTSTKERELLQKGWTQVGRAYVYSGGWGIILAPPEPVPPTLAQKMLDLAERLSMSSDFACSNGGYDCLAAADALEHYERIEAIARKVVVKPHEKGNGVLVDNDLLWELADALNEGRKAPGADSL